MGLNIEQKKLIEDYYKEKLPKDWEFKEAQWVEPKVFKPKQPRVQVIFTIINTKINKGRKVAYNGKKLLKEAKAFYELK